MLEHEPNDVTIIGEASKCLACGHQAHADENASGSIEKRRSLLGHATSPRAQRLCFVYAGVHPTYPQQEFDLLKSAGIRFPAIWAALRYRPAKEFKACASAGIYGGAVQKDPLKSKRQPPLSPKSQEVPAMCRPTTNVLEQSSG